MSRSAKGRLVFRARYHGAGTTEFRKDILFFHKAAVIESLEGLAPNTLMIIDKGAADFVERDVIEAICEFRDTAGSRGIVVELEGIEPVTSLRGH